MKYKEGDIVRLRDGRFVYLKHDEGHSIYGEDPWPGHFTALFYYEPMGIHCADWSIFGEDYNPEYKGAVKVEDHQVPAEFLAKVNKNREQMAESRTHRPIPA